MKPILVNSFSGGRTSGFMVKWVMDNLSSEYQILNVFCNTGQEHEKTLEFVNNCDKHFGFNTVWLEAVVNEKKGKGSGFKIVNFKTADRTGKPFEDAIKKYGIFNPGYPNCTSRLKIMPFDAYMRSLGLKKKDFVTAIGIRIDEYRRVNKKAVEQQIIYPLINMIPTTKTDVLNWWKQQSFDLNIMEHHGNCTWCWKKSLKKHLMLIEEMPEIYDFPRRMEKLHGLVGQNENYKDERRAIFRGNRSTNDLFKLSGRDEDVILEDADSPCGESCEMFPLESV